MIKGIDFNFLVRFTVVNFRFAQIFFISDTSKFVSFQRCSCFASVAFLCFSKKWIFKKYRQTAGSAFGHSGHWIGTLEEGDEALDSEATR